MQPVQLNRWKHVPVTLFKDHGDLENPTRTTHWTTHCNVLCATGLWARPQFPTGAQIDPVPLHHPLTSINGQLVSLISLLNSGSCCFVRSHVYLHPFALTELSEVLNCGWQWGGRIRDVRFVLWAVTVDSLCFERLPLLVIIILQASTTLSVNIGGVAVFICFYQIHYRVDLGVILLLRQIWIGVAKKFVIDKFDLNRTSEHNFSLTIFDNFLFNK